MPEAISLKGDFVSAFSFGERCPRHTEISCGAEQKMDVAASKGNPKAATSFERSFMPKKLWRVVGASGFF